MLDTRARNQPTAPPAGSRRAHICVTGVMSPCTTGVTALKKLSQVRAPALRHPVQLNLPQLQRKEQHGEGRILKRIWTSRFQDGNSNAYWTRGVNTPWSQKNM